MQSFRYANPVLPVSHQFANFPASFRESFSTLEYRRAEDVYGVKGDVLVHTNLSLIDPAFGGAIAFDALANSSVRRFSFDVGPCFEQVRLEDNKYVGVGNKLMPGQVIAQAKRNLARVRSSFPNTCELAIENLNFYPTGAYDGVCDAAFCNEACRELGALMVFDVAHARVTAANLGFPFERFIEELDFNFVCEVHVSRPGFNADGSGVDLHNQPSTEEFDILRIILERVTRSVDVVIEYYRDIDCIMKAYDDLEKLLGTLDWPRR